MQAVGIDMVDMDRFERIVDRWGDKFLKRILTPDEIAYCRQKASAIQSMAARFAAKEALIKCIPSDTLPYFPWHQMEVLNKKDGKPVVILHDNLAHLFRNKEILISLSHTRLSAVAIVVIQDKTGRTV